MNLKRYNQHHCRGNVPFNAATWLLLGSAVLFSVLFYLFVNEHIFKPGFRSLPAEETVIEPDAPVEPAREEQSDTETDNVPASPSMKELELSVEEVIGFDDPPLFPEPAQETESELQKTLTKHPEDRVHISGQIFIDDDASLNEPRLKDIDGAEIDVEIGIQ